MNTITIFQGYDSYAGKDYIKLNKNTSLFDVANYCRINNCPGFVRVGNGQFYIRPPSITKEQLYNNKKYFANKSWRKNIALYIVNY